MYLGLHNQTAKYYEKTFSNNHLKILFSFGWFPKLSIGNCSVNGETFINKNHFKTL